MHVLFYKISCLLRVNKLVYVGKCFIKIVPKYLINNLLPLIISKLTVT